MLSITVRIFRYTRKSEIKIAALAAAACLGLGGCSQNWVAGPGADGALIGQTKARCSLMARHSGSSFDVAGSPKFVAAAALGYAIGDAIRTHNDIDDCMMAAGFEHAPAGQTAASVQAAGTSDSIVDQSAGPEHFTRIADTYQLVAFFKDCTREIRARPIFAPLQPFLPDLESGKFTMQQMTVTRTATVAEGQLFAGYIDETRKCTDAAVAASARFSPPLAAALSKAQANNQAGALAVARLQQSWGDYALTQNLAASARSTQLQSSSL